MIRVFGHFIALEMFGLWLIEFVPCMLALYILLLPTGGDGWADVVALRHAITFALAISAVWVAVGLYQPEVYHENWRLFLGSAVGGLLSLPAVVAVDCSGITYIDSAGFDAIVDPLRGRRILIVDPSPVVARLLDLFDRNDFSAPYDGPLVSAS